MPVNVPEPRIEDYALLADLHTGPLVSLHGSIDWLCLPSFDSAAVFARLLGEEENGHWLLAVQGGRCVSRRYREGTFILESTWESESGRALITEFMPLSAERADLVRRVDCIEGTITVEQQVLMRFNYGKIVPWVRRTRTPGGEHVLVAIAGPDAVVLHGPRLHPDDRRHTGSHNLAAGEVHTWVLTWQPSHLPLPECIDVDADLRQTENYWRSWSQRCQTGPHYAAEVERSLLTLRALTHSRTGGIVAAPTTSLPEDFGGVRNWDYRFCWLRDSAMTIEALVAHGFTSGAGHWRDWLLRAVAGDPQDLQIMYGLAGQRELPERELEHLSGFADSRPVRIGNGAVDQYQSDVVGEVMIALGQLRDAGVEEDEFSWSLQENMLRLLETKFEVKDHGIWEMRGEPRCFTHGRVMMWAAFDQAVRAVEEYGLDGPVERWRTLRERLHEEILEHGYDAEIGSFVQYYGTTEVDASLLQIPQTGFLPYDDEKMLGTVARIEADLVGEHGFVDRYRTEAGSDGLPGSESPFFLCAFWLVEQYAHSGRLDDAIGLMDRLVAGGNDVGLFSEEYDPGHQRQVGNTPQAFSHLGLVRAADAIEQAEHPSLTSRFGRAAVSSQHPGPSEQENED